MESACVTEQAKMTSTNPGHYGVVGRTRLTLQETEVALAWNLQGDPANPVFAERVGSRFGMARLPARNAALFNRTFTAFWLGPASWLLLAGDAVAAAHPLADFTSQRDAINAVGGGLFDVSASRTGWRLAGECAAAALASGCPLDLHERAFPAGACAQSVFGHVGALYVRHANADLSMLVARSLACDVWYTLCASASQYGYEVLAPTPFR